MTIKRKFEEISFHKIVLALSDVEEVNLTALSKKTHLCKQTTFSCVNKLLEWKLINERKTSTLPPMRFISLTDRGKETAIALQRIIDGGKNN